MNSSSTSWKMPPSRPEPRLISGHDLQPGLQAEFERDITAEDVTGFADLSHDWNPLHVDEDYARQSNYQGRIVHGAFQVGLASAMTGMFLPGCRVVVASYQCRFPAPLYFPTRVRVQGEITAWLPKSGSGSSRVRVVELATSTVTSEIHVGFSLHETRPEGASESHAIRLPALADSPASHFQPETKPIVLLTGASGGIGSTIATLLAESYHVIGLGRRNQSCEADEQSCHCAEWIAADLASCDWENTVEQQLGYRRIYGLVHAAWPSSPQGSLLDVATEAVRAQLEFGGVGAIRLAQFLKSHSEADGARLIVLGSTAATTKPFLNTAAYSLAKATIEHAVRLLAPELARSNITINVVAPSFVPVGMNGGKTSKAVLSETAKVPLGRLCSPQDVARTVEFYLSPGAAFITGQVIPLTGGQL